MNIIGRDKVNGIYQGLDEFSSHIILVPANELKPRVINGEYIENLDETKGSLEVQSNKDASYNYARVPVFEHCDLEDYAVQMRGLRNSRNSLAIISKDSSMIYRINRVGPTIDNHLESYRTVLNDWAFPREVGNGRHYLQVAHVPKEDGIKSLPHELVLGFLREKPLDSFNKSKKGYVPQRREMHLIPGRA